mmetsp:Transcript_31958/g.72924  ORF Transcript_31958/g.72924 Transcript_31958/m.72924 type:complete len:774 (+) Transcript_31958:36-2357(+)
MSSLVACRTGPPQALSLTDRHNWHLRAARDFMPERLEDIGSGKIEGEFQRFLKELDHERAVPLSHFAGATKPSSVRDVRARLAAQPSSSSSSSTDGFGRKPWRPRGVLQHRARVLAGLLAGSWPNRLLKPLWQEALKGRLLVKEIIDFAKASAGKQGEGRQLPWIQAAIAVGLVAVCSGAFGSEAASHPMSSALSGSYWLARVVSVRWLAGVAFVAFLVAYYQNAALIGDKGILPARHVLNATEQTIEAVAARGGDMTKLQKMIARAERQPTLLWPVKDRMALDKWLERIAVAGAGLALLAFLRGGASCWQWLAIWVLYQSLMAVGQVWYSFGWESLLLECLALAALTAPAGLLTCSSPGAALPFGSPPPAIAAWAWRWMAFRIMLGAGLIKVRGATSWKDLTAMCYHLETQPIPNPLSRALHNLPRQALLFATAANHVVELFVPWLFLIPWRPAQVAAGTIHIAFQFSLILSGNLSFLNWLTIVPGLWCFDDAVLSSCGSVGLAVATKAAREARFPWSPIATVLSLLRDVAAVGAIVWLSAPVWLNLLGPAAGGSRQRMNSSFDRRITLPVWLCRQMPGLLPQQSAAPEKLEPAPKRSRLESDMGIKFNLCALRLLNTYGAFGSVNKERIEIIFEGTRDEGPNPEWLPYVFRHAVDDPMKRPGVLAPYHLRLDWCRWIASCRGRRASGLSEQWVLSFVVLLLQGSRTATGLLARDGDPFAEGGPPKAIRAQLYLYTFAPPPRSASDPYWNRSHVGQYLPPLTLKDLSQYALN